jgi:ubiquinone/menaquinone biosynthesis C-methylase UbiE
MKAEFEQPILTEFYSKVYRGNEKHDSPEMSRIKMIRSLSTLCQNIDKRISILDIGAGRQALERQFYSTHKNTTWINHVSFFTVDIADIFNYKLLTSRSPKVTHIRANAVTLPFQDNAFDITVSNLAIDFLPHDAFSEVSRTLSEHGNAIFHFHHPSLTKNQSPNPSISKFWDYLDDHSVLFQNERSIVHTLGQHGLDVFKSNIETDGKDSWWAVTATKIT